MANVIQKSMSVRPTHYHDDFSHNLLVESVVVYVCPAVIGAELDGPRYLKFGPSKHRGIAPRKGEMRYFHYPPRFPWSSMGSPPLPIGRLSVQIKFSLFPVQFGTKPSANGT